jgi:hypothetical protein
MKSGTFLDDNNNLGLQEVEIDDLLTAVTESCSEIQQTGNVEEAGRPIVDTLLGSQASFGVFFEISVKLESFDGP